jgi:hypothetical protein
MSVSAIDTTKASRTPAELLAIVQAIYDDLPTTAHETNWLEWKSQLDLDTSEGKGVLAKAIIGFANRSVAQAQLALEGFAYMVVGVEPQSALGVVNLDHATLSQKLKPYVNGPTWMPYAVPFMGGTVLVAVIAPPKDGDPIHVLEGSFQKGKATYRAGTIFIRGAALSEPAGPADVRMLSARLLAGNDVAADVARLAAESDARQTSAISSHAKRVGFVMAPVQGGRSGWKVENGGDGPISGVTVATTNGAQVVVYHGSGPEWQENYHEGVVGAGQRSHLMFRPSDSQAGAAATWSEVETLVVTFADSNGARWRRVATEPPEPI